MAKIPIPRAVSTKLLNRSQEGLYCLLTAAADCGLSGEDMAKAVAVLSGGRIPFKKAFPSLRERMQDIVSKDKRSKKLEKYWKLDVQARGKTS